VVAEPQNDMSLPLRLLLAVTEPPGTAAALFGLMGVVVFLLVLATWRGRKLEINYGAE
jgi:hypothetical protein